MAVGNNERVERFCFSLIDEEGSGYLFSLPASRVDVKIVKSHMHRLFNYRRHKRVDFAYGIEVSFGNSVCLRHLDTLELNLGVRLARINSDIKKHR